MFKFTDSEIDQIKDLYKLHPNLTETLKDFCSVNKIKYTETLRKNINRVLIRDGVIKNSRTLEETEQFKKASGRNLSDSKYYLITYEQSSTPLHDKFYKNLLAYKKYLKAELSVVLGRYKNPTSIFNNTQDTWNETTEPYWDANRHDLHPFLSLLSDIKIQPTAVNPLSGFNTISVEKSAIIAHPKLHLRPMAVLEHHPKKILLTTGACTVANYTDTKAGKRAEANHKIGFVIVEIKDDDIFFIRQVEAKEDGSFIDLFHSVKNGKVSKVKKAKALAWGDTHVGSMDLEKRKASELLQKKLKIEIEIHHDISDGGSVNNHVEKRPLEKYHRYINGNHKVEKDIEQLKQFLDSRIANKVRRIIIPAANHNDRFDRWINSSDWKKDISNAREYIKFTNMLMERPWYNKGILAMIIDERFSENVLTLHENDSYMIGPVEYAQHGHIGASGSRGSFAQFSKSNTPITIGHSHTPMRTNDVMSVGTSTFLREGYNKGMSAWLHCDIIHHTNDTRQQIIIIEGEFTTF